MPLNFDTRSTENTGVFDELRTFFRIRPFCFCTSHRASNDYTRDNTDYIRFQDLNITVE